MAAGPCLIWRLLLLLLLLPVAQVDAVLHAQVQADLRSELLLLLLLRLLLPSNMVPLVLLQSLSPVVVALWMVSRLSEVEALLVLLPGKVLPPVLMLMLLRHRTALSRGEAEVQALVIGAGEVEAVVQGEVQPAAAGRQEGRGQRSPASGSGRPARGPGAGGEPGVERGVGEGGGRGREGRVVAAVAARVEATHAVAAGVVGGGAVVHDVGGAQDAHGVLMGVTFSSKKVFLQFALGGSVFVL